MQKLKKGIIKTLNTILSAIDTTKLESEVRITLVRNYILTKSISNELSTLEEETVKKIVTDEFKELQSKENKTEQDTIRLNELSNQINKEYVDILSSSLNEEVDIDLKTMSEEAFDKLIGEVTDLKPNQFDLIHEVLVKQE